jgi:hypothetical protein
MKAAETVSIGTASRCFRTDRRPVRMPAGATGLHGIDRGHSRTDPRSARMPAGVTGSIGTDRPRSRTGPRHFRKPAIDASGRRHGAEIIHDSGSSTEDRL